jgi:hypothetical protein
LGHFPDIGDGNTIILACWAVLFLGSVAWVRAVRALDRSNQKRMEKKQEED